MPAAVAAPPFVRAVGVVVQQLVAMGATPLSRIPSEPHERHPSEPHPP